ncbi:CHAP domain-containing protein [Jatrophihabitans sp. YIM 134969]
MLALHPRSAPRARVRATLLGVVIAVLAGGLVAVVAPLASTAAPARAAVPTSYGAPSWWNGDCDTVNWTRKARAAGWSGEAARRLGGVVLGIPVCGPRNLAGAPNIWWSRPGWGELEWQCVEFAQRFMIQVYGVQPYQANGVDVVNHYTPAQGGGLVRVDNGTVGKAPQPGDVMSFSSPTNRWGHVAVVASTNVDGAGNGSVLLATQNDTADGWRTLTVSNWRVAAFGSLWPYAWLHDPLGRGGGNPDVDSPPQVEDGDYVLHDNVTYRIAGGAPVIVTNWTTMGGVSREVTPIDDDQFESLRDVPRDGTFLKAANSTARWRVAGGAPLPVASCTTTGMNGCAGSVDIDPMAVTRAPLGGAYAHLRPTIADGTFLKVADDGAPGLGTLGRAAGGAIVPVRDCDDLGGCGDWVTVPATAWTSYRAAHPQPVAGTVVRFQPSGRWGTFANGQCELRHGPGTEIAVPDSSLPCGAPLRPTPSKPPVVVLTPGR